MKAIIVLLILARCMMYGQGQPTSSQSKATDHCKTAPVLTHKQEPDYTEKARRAKVQGVVTLYFEVDAMGHVTNVQVLRSLGFGLDEKAIKALPKSQFRPGYNDGEPTACGARVEFQFRLL